jgi:GMP synthase-like glutamine amidotransferase
MRVHWLAHVPFEGPGTIADWSARRGHALASTRLYAGEPLPSARDFDLLVLMGGPMGVRDVDRHPWLAGEMALVRAARAAGCAVLGVCLGAQLIAAACGARVHRNAEPEIGWHTVERIPTAAGNAYGAAMPDRLVTFHWHADTFALPPGATWLARSAACAHQAFALGERVLGVQFHAELKPADVAGMLEAMPGPLPSGRYVATAHEMLAGTAQAGAGAALMDAWLDQLEAAWAGH